MITGKFRSKIYAIWNTFWTGGNSYPLEVIVQIPYLLFVPRSDNLQTLEENKAARLKKPMARRILPEDKDGLGKEKRRVIEDFRWLHFKNFASAEMLTVVEEHVRKTAVLA